MCNPTFSQVVFSFGGKGTGQLQKGKAIKPRKQGPNPHIPRLGCADDKNSHCFENLGLRSDCCRIQKNLNNTGGILRSKPLVSYGFPVGELASNMLPRLFLKRPY